MLKHQPKTLAKTLDYITWRSPGEYGLFWDPEGTMPWKDFYWALQEDVSLRFVRQSTIRELTLLGIELPFALDGTLLRLRPEFALPGYPPASDVPARLYFGLKPKNLVYTQNIGLTSTRRRFVPVCGNRELALRIARRDEKTPLPIEILAREACLTGLSFLAAGPHLYLVESVPAQFILFPKVRQDLAERLAGPARKPEVQPSPHTAPGSFIVQSRHLEAPVAGKPTKKGAKKDPKGGWKKEGRKERHKRDM
jgi:putative RNA 2'-phosphotransferase